MIKLNGHLITPTVFPDKTSQVWKIDPRFFLKDQNIVTWEFEQEAEFMQVAQLKALLDLNYGLQTGLELPYLPYARQDKSVTNDATFALFPFARLLNSLNFDKIRVFDPHNVELTKHLFDRIEVVMPDVQAIVKKVKALPVYPDLGAAKRYDAPSKALRCEKVREPLTGAITGIKVIGKVKRTSYIIIDDICDGGRTFIEVAKKLYDAGAEEVHLYTSHGIFSKGLGVLREAGIKRIFTRNGEV